MAYLKQAQKGTEHIFKGRTYKCIGTEPYTTRDGRQINLALFEGACAVCGGSFTVKTTVDGYERTNAFYTKHCPTHRKARK